MPELRWTLLILGALFIVALAWWERRRRRQASRDGAAARPVNRDSGERPRRAVEDPPLTLPEIRPRESSPVLPVVEIPDETFEAVQSRAATAVDLPAAPAHEEPDVVGPAAPEPVPDTVPATPEPVVEWPDEEVRRILAVRVVSPPADRFPGRVLRQALAAEGFVLGKLDIFHKADAEGRAVLSAASLTKPGTFDLGSMDTQRFGGLNLFAVLPGPLSPQQAFDELVSTGRNLNDRLRGALQDERGEPLTPTRIAAIREGLGSEPAPPKRSSTAPPEEAV